MGPWSDLSGPGAPSESCAGTGAGQLENDRAGPQALETSDRETRPRVLILSDVRFIREALASILGQECGLLIIGVAGDLDEAEALSRACVINVVLLDTSLPDGLAAVGRIKAFAPDAAVVALGLAETNENVIVWAEAGVAGYVSRSAGLAELTGAICGILRGEQLCPARVAASLLRHLASRAGPANGPPTGRHSASLTVRELEIVHLLAEGLSNKEIARHLGVALSTSKSHVHNLLQKLSVPRRGQVVAWFHRHEAEEAGHR